MASSMLKPSPRYSKAHYNEGPMYVQYLIKY